jgi:hypothetical protein
MTATLNADAIGPVDVALIRFAGNEFNGDVAPALAELHDSGIVRIIDLAFVRKELDGTASFVELEDADVSDAFKGVYADQFDLLNDEDLTAMADALEAGASALVVVWENSWAARLASAVRGSHGTLVAQERIPRENVLRAIAALDEN